MPNVSCNLRLKCAFMFFFHFNCSWFLYIFKKLLLRGKLHFPLNTFIKLKLSSPELQFSLQYWSFEPFHVICWEDNKHKTGEQQLNLSLRGSVRGKCYLFYLMLKLKCNTHRLVMLANCQAHLCGSGRGNMPGHVSSLGRTGPERRWNTPSSDLQMNSSSHLLEVSSKDN